jgi:hypothetical protein
MNQVEHRGLAVLELPLLLIISWHFLLDACELICFLCEEKSAVIMLKILGDTV